MHIKNIAILEGSPSLVKIILHMSKFNFLITVIKTYIGLYVLIYIFPFPLHHLPYGSMYITQPIDKFKGSLNLFVGKYILGFEHLEYVPMNGSGDTTLDYISILSYALLAILILIPILVLVRNRFNLNLFYKFILVYMRYFVGLTLISYGVIKFLHGQFPGPSYLALESSYGDFSPMGLAWRFFGYSDLYKAFMGVSEILAGALLLFRRTQLLGALIAIAVTTNIFIVNLSFDVPVKLFSGHLLFFSILTALPYLRALIDFFLLHKASMVSTIKYPLYNKRRKVGYWVSKVYFVGIVPLGMLIGHIQSQEFRTYPNEWEGVYEITEYQLAGNEVSGRFSKWEKIIIQGKSIICITTNKEREIYSIDNIWNEGEINFLSQHDQEQPYTLKVNEFDSATYSLKFEIGERNATFLTRRKLKEDYLLMNRGFHWVNELPFNR